jgi:hypothetical protein
LKVTSISERLITAMPVKHALVEFLAGPIETIGKEGFALLAAPLTDGLNLSEVGVEGFGKVRVGASVIRSHQIHEEINTSNDFSGMSGPVRFLRFRHDNAPIPMVKGVRYQEGPGGHALWAD